MSLPFVPQSAPIAQDASDRQPNVARALPIITQIAYWYWLAAKQRVPLEDLLELGMAVLRKQLAGHEQQAHHDPSQQGPACAHDPAARLSPLLHQALRIYMMHNAAQILSPDAN